MNSVWKALGAAFTIAALLAGGLAVWSWIGRPARQQEHQKQTYRHAVTKIVVVDSDSGDITIEGSIERDPNVVEIERDLRWTRSKPTFTEEWDGDTLRIRTHCPEGGWLWESDCSIGYTLRVPGRVAVEAETTSGDIRVSGTTMPVKVVATSGDIDLDRLSGDVTARLTSGNIDSRSLASPRVDVEVTSGDVRLAFDGTPTDVKADLTSGNIVIEVPRGAYRVKAATTSGDQEVDVDTSSSAANSITVSSTSGDVRIAYA